VLNPQQPGRRGSAPAAGYPALVTLPERKHRVQIFTRRVPPLITARIDVRFGSHRRLVTLWAWLILLPTTGPFPQTSQR
jgi:hypothetical protein